MKLCFLNVLENRIFNIERRLYVLVNGEIYEGKISEITEDAVFVQIDGITFAVDKSELEESMNIGDLVEGMIYEDKNHKKRLTTELPNVRRDCYDWADVVEVRKDLGVFLDIGLNDKDIVVSLDDLPLEKESWPKKGDKLFVSLISDSKNRLWGKLGHEELLQEQFKKAGKHVLNRNETFRVYKTLSSGVQVITNQKFSGYVHISEMLEPLRLGQEAEGRVIDVHNDGRINLSTKPRAHEIIDDDAQMIYMLLQKNASHFLPYHDKSDPDEIMNYFGISKGQFKRAVGNLLKEKKITQEKGKGIYLIIDGE